MSLRNINSSEAFHPVQVAVVNDAAYQKDDVIPYGAEKRFGREKPYFYADGNDERTTPQSCWPTAKWTDTSPTERKSA